MKPVMVLLSPDPGISSLHASRRVFESFKANDISTPIINHFKTDIDDSNELALQLGTKVGALLADGCGDGVLVEQIGEKEAFGVDYLRRTSFSLLQGSRMRSTKTEFVSCPSCGRTLFDLQETTALIRKRTDHLKGVKIGIMGCIVNGPGEMADADYGYVGIGKDKISLYRGQEVVKRSVNSQNAVDELINLIKEDGNWIEKEAIEL